MKPESNNTWAIGFGMPAFENTPLPGDDCGDYEPGSEEYKQCICEQNENCPEVIYWFHPDHLGSSTFLTDVAGEPYQFVMYLPFDETFAEQRAAGFGSPYLFNAKELDEETGLYYYGARYYDPRVSMWWGVDPLAHKFLWQSPYTAFNNNPILYFDPDGRAAIKSLGAGDPISDLLKQAANYVVNKAKQVAYDATISLTKSAIKYADLNYNPSTIYDNITNPNSDLPQWQAESLAKYSDVAVSSDVFIKSISGLSKNEAKKQEAGRGPLSSQSGGPTTRYGFDPANSDRVIDMRHFLSIGDMGEAIGLGVEVMQSTRESWRPSSFDLQDFYSNNLGKQFYESGFYQGYKSGDVDFAKALENFFENRAEQ